MSIPKYNELYGNILSLFPDQYIEYKTRFVKKTVADQLNLPFEERNELKTSGGEPLIENRVGWALTYLKKAGLLESKKLGYINITEEGLKLYNENPNISDEDLLKIPSYVDFVEERRKNKRKSRAEKSFMSFSSEDKNSLENMFNKLNRKLANELLKEIIKSDFKVFERFIHDLLLKMNFSEFTFELNEDSNELIGIVNQDDFALDKFAIIAINSENINIQNIQNFAGFIVSKGLTKGVLISTYSFDNQCFEYVNNQVNLNISLIDGTKLTELLVKFNVGILIEEIFELKKIDIGYFL